MSAVRFVESLPYEDQERIAIIMEGCRCSESQAIQRWMVR